MKLSLKEQAVIAMIKECIQPLLELKKGFEKQENRVDDIIEGLPAEKYPSVNAVINFVKNKITDFSNNLSTVYVKLLDFDVYKKDVKTSFENLEKGVADTYATKTVVDDLKTNTEVTRTATGNAITIESSQAPLQNLKLFGKTEQNGTPTPDAPIPLVSVGDSGSFEIGICSKNFFYEDLTQGYWNSTTKTIVTSGTHYPLRLASKEFTHIPPSTKIYCMLPYTDDKNRWFAFIGMYDRNKNYLSATQEIKNGAIFETPKDCYYITTTLGKYVNGQEAEITVNSYNHDICFNIDGMQNGVYEPFTKQTLTLPYTLRSVPNTDFKDETDFNKGIVTENTIKFTFNGSENWQTHSYGFILFNYSISIKTQKCVCDKYKFVYWLDLAKSDYGICATDMHSPFICIHDKDCSTLEEFKTKLANNPITVICVRATPIKTPLTETELNAYRHLMTNKGNTTVLSEAEAEVDYYINKPNAQAIGNIHSQVNENYFKLQQAIIETGGN